MKPHLPSIAMRTLLLSSLLLVIVAGCGDTRRQSIQGTVKLDGQPLPAGSIRVVPTQGAEGPSAGAEIVDGKFQDPKATGTFAGTFQVQVTASRPAQTLMRNPETGQMVRGLEQYIPARYNRQTELTAEVRAGEENDFTFELHSR